MVRNSARSGRYLRVAIGGLAVAATIAAAEAKEFRWATRSDPTTMDPHAGNSAPVLGFLNNVYEGLVRRNNPIRVLRDDVVIFEGELESLRRFKEDVADVRAGMECGIGVKNYNDVKVGDHIEVYERVKVTRAVE